MKNLFRAFVIFLFSASFAFSQTVLDSLERELSLHTKADTLRADILNEMVFACIYSDPQRGIKVANENIKLSGTIADHRRKAIAYNYRGLCYHSLGQDSLAISSIDKAYELAVKYKEAIIQGTSLNNKAIVFTNNGKYKEAIALRERALEIFTKRKDEQRIMVLLTNIAVSYYHMGDYRRAIEYNLKALAIKPNDATTLMNIGLNFKKLKDYDKAMQYYNKALAVVEGRNDQAKVNLLSAIATLYDEEGNPGKALEYYNTAVQLAKKIDYKRGEANALADIGIVHKDMGNYPEALRYMESSMVMLKDAPDENLEAVLYTEYADVLLKASKGSANEKEKLAKAQYYAKQAADVAKNNGSQEREMNALAVLAEIYERQGKFEQAFAAHKAFVTIKDSIFKDEVKLDVAKKEMQFEADKKEALAKAETERQKIIKNAIIGGTALSAVLALLFFLIYKRRQKEKQHQKDQLTKAQISNVELKVQLLRLNPHFIFNAMNSIADHIVRNDIKSADHFLAKFAKLMRKTLEYSDKEEISIADELKMLDQYMELEALRLNNKFTYEIKIQDGINTKTTMVPPLILQPFVENSIWHGLSHKEGTGKITIEATRDNDMLKCIVEDDGVGRNYKKQGHDVSKSKSYGIRITKDRIALLNKLKHTNASVHLIDLDKGTRVEVKLPFEKKSSI